MTPYSRGVIAVLALAVTTMLPLVSAQGQSADGDRLHRQAPATALFFSDSEIKAIGEALLGVPAPVAPTPEPMAQPAEPPPPPEPETEPKPVAAAPVEAAPLIYGPSVLYLSAIVYFSPDSWSFWLNGKRITPETSLAQVDVVSVSRDGVELALHVVSDRPAVTVRLRPNQTFIARSGDIVEGRPTAYADE